MFRLICLGCSIAEFYSHSGRAFDTLTTVNCDFNKLIYNKFLVITYIFCAKVIFTEM